jgi:hypothetical protein
MFFKIEIEKNVFFLARASCIWAPKSRLGTQKISVPHGGRPPNPYINQKLRARATFLWV